MEHDAVNQPPEQPLAPDLAAYFDGELSDPEEVARFESMIREDARVREQLHEYEVLRTHLRRLPKTEAPPYLRKRIAYMISARGRRMNALRMVSRLVVAGAMVAAVVAVGAFWNRPIQRPGNEPIYAAMVADHVKYKPATSDTELFEDNPADLETWLSARLDFSPEIPRWDWAELKSGRPCSLNGYKVALVRYRCGGDEMSLYIWPANRPAQRDTVAISHAPEIMTTDLGFEVALWSRDDLTYGLVAERGTTSITEHLGNTR
ncbi:MAG: hypothetical protein HYV26_14055 [Candidatus Hydrogenedentes bacterium]|nr:hypothetical protein [Candidatus Hydrogenedentota bacterium]